MGAGCRYVIVTGPHIELREASTNTDEEHYSRNITVQRLFMATLFVLSPFRTVVAQPTNPAAPSDDTHAELRDHFENVVRPNLRSRNLADQRFAIYGLPVVQTSGTKINTLPQSVTIAKDSWTFFIDKNPGANWEHNAEVVTVAKGTNTVTISNVRMPPENLHRFVPLNQNAKKETAARLDRENALTKNARPRAAIVFCGGYNSTANYERYWNDLSTVYRALKEVYSFSDSEIRVVYANGTRQGSEDLDGDGTADIDFAATLTGLDSAFSEVALALSNGGAFFFFATNHGGHLGGRDASLYLWGGTLTDDGFAARVATVRCESICVVMEQCYSGGMIDDLELLCRDSDTPACFMSACRHDQVSYACDTEGEYDEYVYHWTAAVRNATPDGAVVDADVDGDGVVSMGEAHAYAKDHDSQDESPQIVALNGGESLSLFR